ncbi:energy transducer TonB [uncultured Algimonas sp.]|uniref:energy transducer TonB n=1 Tax=uncultured Algimonas sp. TaxID=1547920 RepID=UPI0026104021|nr:energy transducer TonB [uncultured Algimonas sp.]
MGALRWLAIIPAAIVTVVLFVLMMSLISEEFKPEDKLELDSFEINPKVEEIEILERKTTITEVKKIETPPPPPQIERAKADRPSEPIASMEGAVPEFEAPEIDRSQFQITVSDRDAQPLVRIPPIMPPRAEKSGHCNVKFNVSPEGQPFDVVATYCTQSVFERPTIRSVQKWKYNPKIQEGRPVGRVGVISKVSFRLQDERGNIIPE